MKHIFSVTAVLVALFVLSQLIGLGILAAWDQKDIVIDLGAAQVEVERPDIDPDYSAIYILTFMGLGTLLIFFIIWLDKPILWRAWFFIATVLCMSISLTALLPSMLPALVALILAYYKFWKPNMITHNLTEVLIYPGLASLFVPVLNLKSATMLLIFISLYDAYAVWKSKHMIKLAQFQTKANMFAGLMISYGKKGIIAKAKSGTGKMVKVQNAVLGGGDMGFPLLFTGAVFNSYGWWAAMIIPFTTLALILLFRYGKKGKFYPAMPFLSLGCFVGYGALLLLI